MDSIKVLAMVEEAKVHDLKRRELIKYVLKLRKFVVKQNEKIVYQKNKISHLVCFGLQQIPSSVYNHILFQKEKLKGLALVVPEQKCEKSPAKPADADPEERSPERKEQEKFLDDIKSAAEAQSLKNGFVYEPTSGLYYDRATGYYYNAECGLYYDGGTAKYYSYDQATKEFTYHSTAVFAEPRDTEESSVDRPKNAAGKKRKVRKKEPPKEAKTTEDLEDGEISSEDSYVECSSDDDHIYEDISKHYPPSLRVIVQQSAMEKLKVGSLFLVTCKGGSLGREGQHDVVIPDINVSKCHLKFTYDEAEASYKCQDQGSRNGTLLNGTRMSESTQESDLFSIPHGSVIQISETKLLCHVHPGAATCGYCEPGLLMQATDKSSAGDSSSSGPSHKSQLKRLQRKYGLEKESEWADRRVVGKDTFIKRDSKSSFRVH